jgi:hypothetical protein
MVAAHKIALELWAGWRGREAIKKEMTSQYNWKKTTKKDYTDSTFAFHFVPWFIELVFVLQGYFDGRFM